MDNVISFLMATAIVSGFLLYHLKREKKKVEETRAAAENGKLRSVGPQREFALDHR